VQKNGDDFVISQILEYVNCNICGGTEYHKIKDSSYGSNLTLSEFIEFYSSSSETKLLDQLVQCVSCSLIFVNPRISTELSFKGYQDAIDVRHHNQDLFRVSSFKSALKKINMVVDLFSGSEGPRTFLDIGCAGGAFPKAVKDLGFQVVGLEPSVYLSKHARKEYGLEVHAMTLEEYSRNGKLFDVVSLWDVLEHLSDPKQTLQKIHAMLPSEGLLILNLPMIDTLPARIMGFRWPFYLNVHIYYFTLKTIEALLLETGYEIQGVRRYWQTLSLGYVLNRAGIKLPEKVEDMLNVPFRYYMGQRTIIVRKKSD
jgi:SAM-dependent methyltransferase